MKSKATVDNKGVFIHCIAGLYTAKKSQYLLPIIFTVLFDAAVKVVDQDLRKLIKSKHKMLLVFETEMFPHRHSPNIIIR